MKEAHDRAHEILTTHREQMDLMASVLLERETVEGEACEALLDNRWDDYLKHEDEINARKEAEEQAARERDAKLADPNWKEEPVEPGDQNPNPPYREPAEGDRAAEGAKADASASTPASPVTAVDNNGERIGTQPRASSMSSRKASARCRARRRTPPPRTVCPGRPLPRTPRPRTTMRKATKTNDDLALFPLRVRHQDAHCHGHLERYPRFVLRRRHACRP